MLSNLLLFHGENNYLIRQAINDIKNKFISSEGDLNLKVFEARSMSSTMESEIISACETPPFLGNQRLTIVRDFDFKKSVENLLKFLEDLPQYTTLLVTSNKADARTKLFKFFKKHGEVHEFKDLKPSEFRHWLNGETNNRDIKLNPDALELLTTFTLGSCESAINELAKLKAYSNQKTVTRQDVEILVHPDLHTSVFRLTDAIGERKIGSALSSLHDIVNRGENLIQIFFMIVRQFRILLNLQAYAIKKLSPASLAKELKLHPFVVQSSLRQLRNFSKVELLESYRRLLDIDTAVKKGKVQYNPSNPTEFALALEKFIIGFI